MTPAKKYVPRRLRRKQKQSWQMKLRAQLEQIGKACQVYLREILISWSFWYNQLVIPQKYIHSSTRVGEKHRQRKQANEDKEVVKSQFCDKEDCMFLGVFDGHGGTEAADFCSDLLPRILAIFIETGLSMEEALKKSFAKMEEDFNKYARENSLTSGTTCTCAILDKRTGMINIANIGDCEAILSKRGEHKILTQIHHAEAAKEKERIEAAGGTVHGQRLNGDLEISRSFGDLQFLEDQATLAKPQGLIAEPYVCQHSLTAEDEFLILASDGIFESFHDSEDKEYKYERCLTIVREELKRSSSTKAACAKLLEKCGRTEDDVTCVIVAFPKFMHPKFIPGNFEPIIVRD